MATKIFTRKYLKDELELPENDEYVLSDKIYDNGRWTIAHALIFKDPADNKIYSTTYRVGATEMQDEEPWEYENNIEAEEMQLIRTIKHEYVNVESNQEDIVWAISKKLADSTINTLNSMDQIYAELDNFLQNYSGHNDLEANDLDTTIDNASVTEENSSQETAIASINPIRVRNFNQQEIEESDKFIKKFIKKMDNVFDFEADTSLTKTNNYTLSSSFTMLYKDGGIRTYCFDELYTKYLDNKENGNLKPLRSLVDEIKEDFDKYESITINEVYPTLWNETTQDEFRGLVECCDGDPEVLEEWENEAIKLVKGNLETNSNFIKALQESYDNEKALFEFIDEYNEFYHNSEMERE